MIGIVIQKVAAAVTLLIHLFQEGGGSLTHSFPLRVIKVAQAEHVPP